MKKSYQTRARSKRSSKSLSAAPPFLSFAESNPDPILITNTRGEIQYVNSAWEKLTGYTLDEVRGKNPGFLKTGKTPPRIHQLIRENLKEGRSFVSEEIVDRAKDGSEFSIRATYFPVIENGAIVYLVQVLNEVSERRELEKRKDALISVASHEIRTPLSVIKLSIELLMHELGTVPKEILDIVRTIQDETGRVTALLNTLLNARKIESGTLNLQKKKHNLKDSAATVIREIQITSPVHTIMLEGQGASAMYDETRINEVFNNLISNAVKYSPRADKVVVKVYSEGGSAVVSVQDFGIGIRPLEQKKIFDMFYRAKNKDTVEGFGLGLYIAAQIIGSHGGKIWVTSKPRVGSTFYFSLPGGK